MPRTYCVVAMGSKKMYNECLRLEMKRCMKNVGELDRQ